MILPSAVRTTSSKVEIDRRGHTQERSALMGKTCQNASPPVSTVLLEKSCDQQPLTRHHIWPASPPASMVPTGLLATAGGGKGAVLGRPDTGMQL